MKHWKPVLHLVLFISASGCGGADEPEKSTAQDHWGCVVPDGEGNPYACITTLAKKEYCTKYGNTVVPKCPEGAPLICNIPGGQAYYYDPETRDTLNMLSPDDPCAASDKWS